jgi:uncharacterized protein YneF (UPF0154 family)
MSTEQIYCIQCGHPNPANAKFCSNCASQIVHPEEGQPTVQVPHTPQGYSPPHQPTADPPQQPPPAYTPPPQAPPVYAQAPQREKKSGSGLRTCGILLVILVCLCGGLAAGGWFFGDKILDYALQQFPDIEQMLQTYLGTDISQQILQDMITGETSTSVTSAVAGEVSAPNGAKITIPAGAVPPMDDGSAGTMVFSIEEAPDQNPSLPGDFEPLGSVYSLGPEGFVFSMPIEITLPIPEDVDPETVMGLTYYDTATETWQMVPGAVDTQTRTASVNATHFSYWGLFGRCSVGTFGGCRYAESVNQWNQEHGGWFKVTNGHSYNSGSFPGGRHYGMSSGYGVCIQSYAFEDANRDAWNWIEPINWKIMAYDGKTYSYWVPRGRYELIEFISLSEVNNDPLYVPDYTTFWRPIGAYTITAGDTIEFQSANADWNDGSFTEGRPPCWGAKDTSVGTGDVQVTLTWQTNDDIDLYVIDPNGEEISYLNMTSSSGGTLDRDNLCPDMIIGRPENIFWAENTAPSGSYQVKVNYFGACESAKAVNWTVRVIVQGNVQTYTGTLTEEYQTQDVTTFTVP